MTGADQPTGMAAAGLSSSEFVERRRDLVREGSLKDLEKLNDQLELMPGRNADLALEVYRKLAYSPNPEEREAIAVRIDLLLGIDREAAIDVWRDLLADPQPQVREAATETLLIATDDGTISPPDAAGISRQTSGESRRSD